MRIHLTLLLIALLLSSVNAAEIKESAERPKIGLVLSGYRLSEDGFFGSLSMPMYAGWSIEAGSSWYDEGRLNSFESDRVLYAGSAFVAMDTIIGPFYLGVGTTELDYYSLYLSLGKSF
ncbi:MAG: hypothetical protein ABFR02_11035 [Campylobacterota bacterium]